MEKAALKKGLGIFGKERLLKISRVRFWIYVLGPFLLGAIAAGDPRLWSFELALTMIVLLLFFTFPANLLVYGVNDIFDYETDKHNPKKVAYEGLVLPREQKKLWKIISMYTAPFLLFSLFLSWQVILAILVFFLTSVFYSALPIRAKAKPPFDIIFSSLIYISPAVVAFFATGNTEIPWLGVVGGLSWAFAMQTYSAVPDINADKEGGVNTLATVLGKKKALFFCLLAYIAAAIIGFFHVGVISLILALVYVYMVTMTLRDEDSFFWYKKFPLINTAAGMILFFALASSFLV